jgi:exodeoxyribonuclease VII small subunit
MAKKTQTPPKSFEEALAELERILAEIEGGELGLEESLAKYERGNFLIHHCRGVLNVAEKQIDLLSKSADGGLTATPMQDATEARDNSVGPEQAEAEDREA